MKSSFFSINSRWLIFLLLFTACQIARAQYDQKRELRAAWIATVLNIDWPSQKGLSAQKQQEEFIQLLDQLKAVGMNAVIVQVRPVADALYPSSYEPWSEYLSGTQGLAPEPYYNPLTFMIEQARLRGMEFHAWFNPYRASMKENATLSAEHPFALHPEWFLTYGGKLYYDPGHPEARAFVLNAIMETVKHYDIDAVHFDDYFYPYRIANQEFPDSSSYVAYGKAEYPNVEDWRRSNVDFFVRELSTRIKKEKPHVKFGISPFGVWRNSNIDPRGSVTQAGQTNYDDLFADVLKWLEESWIDYITPQIYWHIGFERAEYKTLVDWWSKNAFGKHVYIGQGIYRIGEKGWEDPDEIVNQVKYNRTLGSVHGSMYFSAKIFAKNKNGVNTKIKSLYKNKALVPIMPWIKSQPLYAPRLENISGTPRRGLNLEWRDVESGSQAFYIVYRFKSAVAGSLDDPSNILAVVPRQSSGIQSWVDKDADKRTVYTYIVTSADRLYNESAPGNPVAVKTRGAKSAVKKR